MIHIVESEEMKPILRALTISLLLATAAQATSTAKELIATMTSGSAAWDVRCEAEDALKNLPPRDVLQALLPHIKGMPSPIIWNSGGRDFDKRAPVEWQVFYAVSRSWNKSVKALPQDSGGALLLSLLRRAETTEARRRILMDLTHRWVPEAEAPVAVLMKAPDGDLTVRTTAALALILHGEADYHNLLVQYAQEGDFSTRKRWFDLLSDPRHKKHTGIDPQIVQIGFDLILEDRKVSPNYIHGAYFLAIKTGHYIGEEFKPDRHKPQYQGKQGGLTESFFADTVINAMGWWKDNRNEVEKRLPTRQTQRTR